MVFVLTVAALVFLFHRITVVQRQLADADARLRRMERALAELIRSGTPPQEPAPSTEPLPSATVIVATPEPPPRPELVRLKPDATDERKPTVRLTPDATDERKPPVAAHAQPSVEASAATAHNLEEQIGSRWMLVVGTLVLVIGVTFFVKYAFDRHWIDETARVAIGTAAGIALWILGLRLAARGYDVYGRVVAGGGFATMYVSAYAASALYGLVPDAAGFAWMAATSGATAVTADRQRSPGLALMAVAFAYIAPFLVASDRDHHVVLFVYDTTLAVATWVLVRRHRWPVLGPASFWLTWTTFAAWAASFYNARWYAETEFYLTAVSVIFLLVLREYRRASDRLSQIAALAVAIGPALYYVASVIVLYDHSLWLLVFLIAFTAAAIALIGEWPAARLALWAAVALPFFAWSNSHAVNVWFVATIATAGAIYVLHLAAQLRVMAGVEVPRESELALFHANSLGLFAFTYLAVGAHGGSTSTLATALAVWNGALAYAFRRRLAAIVPHTLVLAFAFTAVAIAIALNGPWITVAWAAEGAAVMWVGLIKERPELRYGGLFLLALATARLIVLQFDETTVSFVPVLNSRAAAGGFIVALMYITGAIQRRISPADEKGSAAHSWIVAANLLTVGLVTADIVSFWRLREETVAVSFARQLSISLAWAAYAMGLIMLGFRRRSTTLRYLALWLFGATVVKMFLVDLLELDGVYRIAGFVSLGVVLLIASFFYQRQQFRTGNTGT